ncbi:hypothetical protein SERLA73DRAFT_141775, partial [Serpula lacrymans var. lacrymans S7.3]
EKVTQRLREEVVTLSVSAAQQHGSREEHIGWWMWSLLWMAKRGSRWDGDVAGVAVRVAVVDGKAGRGGKVEERGWLT